MLCYERNAMGEPKFWNGTCLGCKHGAMETSSAVRCLVTRRLHYPTHPCSAVKEERKDPRVKQ